MPGYKGHILFAFFLIIGLALLDFGFNIMPNNAWWWFAYIPAIIFWAILPDLDTPASKARWIIMVLGLLLIIGLSLYQAFVGFAWTTTVFIVLTAVLLLVPWFLKHRGITHSFLIGLLLSIPLFFFAGWQFFLIGLVAFWSHLLLDAVWTLIEHGHAPIRLI